MKSIKFIILLAAILLLFASCQGGASSGTDESTTSETETAAELKFSENGKCDFYIVYPEDFDEDIENVAKKLAKQAEKYTGAKLNIVSDRLLDNPTGNFGVEHEFEILLGPTNREASVKAHEGMRTKDYGVTFEGSKIVFAGMTADSVNKACEWFINNIFLKQGKDDIGNATIKLTGETTFVYTYGKYAMNSCTIAGGDIGEYSITFLKDSMYSAERNARLFTNFINTGAGFSIELSTKINADGKQIIFGESDTDLPRHGYSVREENGNLYISAECMEGYGAAYTYLTETLFKGDKVEIASGFKYSGVSNTDKIEDADTRAGEYRVIFNNIYGNHQEEHPIRTRNRMQAELHYEYLPDVIGTQETSEAALSYVTAMNAKGYATVSVTVTNSNKHNYTPLLYRKDKLEVVDKGYHLFDDGAGDRSKSVTWAVFKDKTTGDVFAVGSTHFYWTDDALGQSARLKDAEQVSELAKTITEKYACPFIIGGDFNCRIDSAPFGILNKNGFKNLQNISEATMDLTTHHEYSEFDKKLEMYYTPVIPKNAYSTAIDHALVYNESKLAAKMFRVLTHDYTCLSSDHCPIMVDFDIN